MSLLKQLKWNLILLAVIFIALVYNVPLLLAAWRLMGKKYTIDIVIGTVLFSLCLDATRFLNGYLPVEDLMLAAIFGGVFNGIGYGIVFRMDGSTGGFDIIGAMNGEV